ncbi:hypothetical protein [[Kitasatospora] papulosa]
MASGAGLTLAWSGAALACLVLVVAAALTVRAFWNYTTPAPPCTGALQPATD